MHRLDLGPQLPACAGYRQARYVRNIVAVSTRPSVSDRSNRATSDEAADASVVVGPQMESWGRSVLQLRRHRSSWTRAPAMGKSTCNASIRLIRARSRSETGVARSRSPATDPQDGSEGDLGLEGRGAAPRGAFRQRELLAWRRRCRPGSSAVHSAHLFRSRDDFCYNERDHFYSERLMESIGYVSPAEYEAQYHRAQADESALVLHELTLRRTRGSSVSTDSVVSTESTEWR